MRVDLKYLGHSEVTRDAHSTSVRFAPNLARPKVFFDGEVSHAVRKVPASGDYRVQAHHGGSEEPHVVTEAELATARAALALAPAGVVYARVDLVEHEGVPTVMELELIEPDLFLRADDRALERFVDCVEGQLPSA